MATATIARPEARTFLVEELVQAVLDGRVRIPVFQRPIAWDAKNVRELFDSIYRGFPIGSLLLRRGPADAAKITIGPIDVMCVPIPDALWVVDGQQRLTSLAAALGRSRPIPTTPADLFVVYFDAQTEVFCSPDRRGEVPTTWVPLPALLDSAMLGEWVIGWTHAADTVLRTKVFEAGKRLREYRVPAYVIDTADEELLRTIYFRANGSGKPLTWAEVHDGLFGHRGTAPSSLSELATSLESLGMGRLDDDTLLTCLVAWGGRDPTRAFKEHLDEDPRFLEGAVAAARPALEAALAFLASSCEIPHLRLLPYPCVLVVLTRFFREHPAPNPRSRELLVRWAWRVFAAATDDRTVLRGVKAITVDEEGSVQRLLTLPAFERVLVELGGPFEAHSAKSRLAMLALASLRPQRLDGSGPIDVAALIQDHEGDAIRQLSQRKVAGSQRAANRILLPGDGDTIDEVRAAVALFGPDHALLWSHAISSDVVDFILLDDIRNALVARHIRLMEAAWRLCDRLAAWGRTDRPTLAYLLQQAAG